MTKEEIVKLFNPAPPSMGTWIVLGIAIVGIVVLLTLVVERLLVDYITNWEFVGRELWMFRLKLMGLVTIGIPLVWGVVNIVIHIAIVVGLVVWRIVDII